MLHTILGYFGGRGKEGGSPEPGTNIKPEGWAPGNDLLVMSVGQLEILEEQLAFKAANQHKAGMPKEVDETKKRLHQVREALVLKKQQS